MTKESNKNESINWLGLTLELGYMVAIPAVVGAIGGRYLDQKFDSTPIFLLFGIFFSITVSTIAVMRKVMQLTAIMDDKTKKEQESNLEKSSR